MLSSALGEAVKGCREMSEAFLCVASIVWWWVNWLEEGEFWRRTNSPSRDPQAMVWLESQQQEMKAELGVWMRCWSENIAEGGVEGADE